jgi:hypothetical protein
MVSHRAMIVARSFLATLFLATAAANADAQARDATTAQALFDRAKELMSAGKAAEACPKFAESQKLDPGLGTLLNLAACYETVGRFASAWSTFLEAESAARSERHQEGIRISRERAAALVPKLSRLVVSVSGEQPPGLEITRDGVPIGPAQLGEAMPADPGKHTIVATAPGRAPYQTEVTLAEAGATVEAKIPELAVLPRESAPAFAAPPPKPAPVTPVEPRGGLSPQRYAAIGAGAVGLTGVVVGSIFGLQSKSKRDDAESHCSAGECRDQAGVDLREEARSAGNVSTVAFIVGGVGLAGGAVLWFTGGNSTGSSTGLLVAPGSVAVRARF